MTLHIKFPETVYPQTTVNTNKGLKTFQKNIPIIALQKKGELTKMSLKIISEAFGLNIKQYGKRKKDRILFLLEKGCPGLVFVKNNDLCRVVSEGLVDAAIVGFDQVYEYGQNSKLSIINNFPKLGNWNMVLATPEDSILKNLLDFKLVATEYPKITRDFFNKAGNKSVKIMHTHGSTEVYPLLKHGGTKVDGIIDIRVSGKTLKAHGMITWNPTLMNVNPVIIGNKSSLLSKGKMKFFNKLKNIDYDN